MRNSNKCLSWCTKHGMELNHPQFRKSSWSASKLPKTFNRRYVQLPAVGQLCNPRRVAIQKKKLAKTKLERSLSAFVWRLHPHKALCNASSCPIRWGRCVRNMRRMELVIRKLLGDMQHGNQQQAWSDTGKSNFLRQFNLEYLATPHWFVLWDNLGWLWKCCCCTESVICAW